MAHAPKRLADGGIFEQHVSPKDQAPIPKEGYVDPRYADVKKREGGPGSGRHKGEGSQELNKKTSYEQKTREGLVQRLKALGYHELALKTEGAKNSGQIRRIASQVNQKSIVYGNTEHGSELGRIAYGLHRHADDLKRNKESQEKAPPGWEGTVKKMKKHPEIDNPFALAWSMKNKGDTPHESRSMESRREDDSEQHNMMGDFLNEQSKHKPHKPGWDGAVYTPPVVKRQEPQGVVIKEF